METSVDFCGLMGGMDLNGQNYQNYIINYLGLILKQLTMQRQT